jgi:hypothetical protein
MHARPLPPATNLHGRWLVLAQVVWVTVAVLTAGVFVTGIPGEFERQQVPCTGGLSCVWVPRLSAHKAQELGELGLSTDLFAAYFVAVEVAFMAVPFAIGAAIFWRRSDDRMALLGSLMLITFGATITIPYPLLNLPLPMEVLSRNGEFSRHSLVDTIHLPLPRRTLRAALDALASGVVDRADGACPFLCRAAECSAR